MSEFSIEQLARLSLEDKKAYRDGGVEAVSLAGKKRLRGDKSFFRDNLETVGSIGGALVGSLAGPAGTVAGGALGAMGGQALEDVIAGRRIDPVAAAKEGAISVGIDVATLGAGKFLRPFFRSGSNKVLGKEFKEVLEQAAPARGSAASKAQSQELFLAGGTSLDPRMTDSVGTVRKFFTEIGEVGLVAREFYQRDAKARRDVIVNTIQKWSSSPDALNVEDVGRSMYNIVEAGKQAASDIFGAQEADIVASAGGKQLPLGRLKNHLAQFVGDNSNDLGFKFHKSVKKELDDFLEPLKDIKTVNFQTLIDMKKSLNAAIDEAMPMGASTTISRQLVLVKNAIGEGIGKTMEKSQPELWKRYSKLNDDYAGLLAGVIPEMSVGLLARAKDKGNFQALGAMLVNQTNTSQIKQFMASIDKSYGALAEANKGLDIIKTALPEGIETAAKAKKIIRDSYTRNLFNDGAEETVFNKSTLNQTMTKEAEHRLAAIYGDEWAPFKRLLNAIHDQTQTKTMGAWSLALRTRELQGAITAGSAIYGGSTGGAQDAAQYGGIAALGVFALPVVAYRVATNPRAVNQLLMLDNQLKKAGGRLKPEVIAAQVLKVYSALSPEDRTAIREEADAEGLFSL